MGARTLEASLRRRLVALVVPALVGVAAASIAITAHALRAADEATARARCNDVLRVLRGELDEGDAPDKAVAEAIATADDDGARVVIRGPDGREHPGAVGPRLGALPEGACDAADDERGRPWVACGVARGGLEATLALPVERHRSVVRTLGAWMGAMVALALVAMLAAARLAVREPLAALTRLAVWSERVVASDRPPLAPVADTLEIARLTGSFERLVGKLVDALARERATSAHIAHELRTPLTAMRAELEAMAGAGSGPAERVLGDVEQLARVIDAILVLSSTEAPARGEGPVNLADVARELAPEGARVEAPDEALVAADPRLVELAVRNLLENAERHAGRPARALRVTRAGEGARVAIVDDGPGLDAEARARMFERHWRGAGAQAGSGLGLALVRAVATRYGGDADARPNADGLGLEVSFSLGPVLEWHEGSAEGR